MRYGRYHLRQSWVILLMWFLYSIGCPSPSFASTPHVLKDVRTVYQNGQWHVVLTGSQAMTYRTLKADDAQGVRLIVDLINTLNEMSSSPLVLNTDVIGAVTTIQLVREPQPRTRVEISLTKDTPYRITRSGEKIWISFDTTQPKIEVEPSRTEPVAKPKAHQSPVTKEIATPEPSPGKPTPLPPPLERKSLPSASKVLSVRQLKMDQELRYDIIVDGSLADYVAFHLTSPPRVAVDLIGVKSTEVEKALSFDGPWVKGVRFGVYNRKVRVVFDLIPEGGLPYDIISEEDRLIVSFKPGSAFTAMHAIEAEKVKKRRLPTGQLGELGENLVILQLLARGAEAAYKLPLGAPADDLVVHLEDEKVFRVQVKARRTGTWQPTYKDHYAEADPDNDTGRFWVFVDLKAIDLGKEPPRFYIAPAGWVENYIYAGHMAYLERKGLTQKERPSRHHSLHLKDIEQWRDRWDLLGVSDIAKF